MVAFWIPGMDPNALYDTKPFEPLPPGLRLFQNSGARPAKQRGLETGRATMRHSAGLNNLPRGPHKANSYTRTEV